MNILITGSQGFIGSYVCDEFLSRGHKVVGIDNMQKYGPVTRPQDEHPNFALYKHDLTKPLADSRAEIPGWFDGFDIIIAGAALIGGISYFNKYSYDLLANNERIMGNTFDFAIKLHQANKLGKIVVISSSMVFENTDVYPTPESEVVNCKPPSSSYGFQKLACEYYCRAAYEQYGVSYNIARPFNCVGVGEDKSIKEDRMTIGNNEMLMSHVLPDLVSRALKSEKGDKCVILGDGSQVRHYTNGKDIARGIRIIAEHPNHKDCITNEDFNISSDRATTVAELATIVWNKIHGCDPVFEYHTPLNYDVQMRSPDVSKARRILGFEAEISLEDSVDEVINYMGKFPKE
jgi:UDP-glucose 4-epimerase